ncbi:MAG: ABC transporter substrate-binding protein, partial [Promethearchaeota archaeon]
TFWIIEDDIALNTAVLAGDIDLCDDPLYEFHPQFRADPDIVLVDAGLSMNIEFLGFNGEIVNTNFRKAISYAINYSYLIDVIMLGNGYRLKSPIPESLSFWSNYSFNYPVFDRVYAQSVMQSIGYGIGFTSDQDWLDQADAGGWPGTTHWNITAPTEGTTRRDFALYISDNLRYLGLDVPVVQIPFESIIGCMVSARKTIPMYQIGWTPKYIDPENYITPLYSNRSTIWVETYDYELEQLMLQGELTLDNGYRKTVYNEIQRKLVEELYFFAWIATGKNYDVYQDYVKGWVPNAIGRLDFYQIYLY